MKTSITLLLLCCLPGMAFADESPAARTLKADMPAAAAVKHVTLGVSVGEVHVTASPDDAVHVKVTLKQKEREFLWFFHWMSNGTAADIAGASVAMKQQGDTLTLGLNYKGDADNDDLKQEWDVQLPARLALDTNMKVGELTIAGIRGGLDVSLNVGELNIDVPGGRMKAEVNVGEIRAKSASADYGKLKLSSSIGEAVIYINGTQNGYHDHGGLGNTVSVDGKGHDDMTLSVNIGEASLRIESPEGAGK
ncbi:MAG TPA: hypothetical protein VGO35_08300 [Gammaproteobacteria bacterium]|jgi:hypothetical protein|nr:hypothetical protein [Gammaproteobacteria bacterium]